MRLDRQSPTEQLLFPVIVEPLKLIGDEQTYRCRTCSTYFDWTDPKSRLELKAIALLVYRHLKTPIPLIQVTPDEMEQFTNGVTIPAVVLRKGVITNPSLEDFVLTTGWL